MKTLKVNIEDRLSEKDNSSLDALKLEYEIDDYSPFQDETGRVMANPNLVDKLTQSRKDMEEGKGTEIALKDLWM